METRPVYYCMLDPRWRWDLYDINPGDGPDYIGTAGCGPTTAAMLAAALTGDRAITPPVMAQFAIDHGDRTRTNGTARSLFAHVGQAYGLAYRETTDVDVALGCLREGGLVVCHVGPGRWTRGGHYILWWGCDGTNVAINDPSGDTPRRNTGTLAELRACRKAFVCFWPKKKEETDMTREEVQALVDGAVAAVRPREYTDLTQVPAWAQELVKRAMRTPSREDPARMLVEGDERGKLHLTGETITTLELLRKAGMLKGGVV